MRLSEGCRASCTKSSGEPKSECQNHDTSKFSLKTHALRLWLQVTLSTPVPGGLDLLDSALASGFRILQQNPPVGMACHHGDAGLRLFSACIPESKVSLKVS